jgi:hypothetical protein
MNARMTLLEMVQNILSAMDSDDVNSIGDTVEALQVAEVVKETYFGHLLSENLPGQGSLVQLQSVSDSTRPNYLRLPTNVKQIFSLAYDVRTDDATDYKDTTYIEPQEFIRRSRNSAGKSDCIEVTDPSGVRFWVNNKTNPTYYTSFDNDYIITDSYNSDQESTLQADKSMCWGELAPVFEMDDDFVPRLDVSQFPLLLAEAKATCFVNFKQASNAKEEQKIRRYRVRTQNDLWRANQRKPYERGVDYGRKGRRTFK